MRLTVSLSVAGLVFLASCGVEGRPNIPEVKRSSTVTTQPSPPAAQTQPPAPTAPSPPSSVPIAASPSPAAGSAVDVPSPTDGEVRYTFPIDPPGSARYGRSHHDYPATDIFAPCGRPVVAVTAGRVDEISTVDSFDPKTNDPSLRGGLFVSIVGDDGVRYYGSHLASVDPAVQPGARVGIGQTIGTVGDSGNAKGTGCHLHFGISPPCGPGDWEVRRGVIYPWRYLDSWKAGGHLSPSSEVTAWSSKNRAC